MTDEAHNYHITITFQAADGIAQQFYTNLKGAQIEELGVSALKTDESASTDIEVKVTWPGRAMNAAAVLKETASIIERVLKGDVPASLTIACEELGAGYPFDHEAMVLG